MIHVFSALVSKPLNYLEKGGLVSDTNNLSLLWKTTEGSTSNIKSDFYSLVASDATQMNLNYVVDCDGTFISI